MKKDKLYEEYVIWLKETHDLTPEQTFGGINAILECVSIRDEVLGRMGETELIKMLKKDGVFEQRKRKMENSKFTIITFDEYKNSKQK